MITDVRFGTIADSHPMTDMGGKAAVHRSSVAGRFRVKGAGGDRPVNPPSCSD